MNYSIERAFDYSQQPMIRGQFYSSVVRRINIWFPKFLVALLLSHATSVWSQSNPPAPKDQPPAVSNVPAQAVQTQLAGNSTAQRAEEIRAACIQNRRLICGKIVAVLPEGLVVDSGYTNLLREPLKRSWLIPGSVAAARAENLVESREPASVCLGLVFLTDLPQIKGAGPKAFDYVNLEAFPVGQFTYTSVGDLRRTVRKFSGKLANAVKWQLAADSNQNPPLK